MKPIWAAIGMVVAAGAGGLATIYALRGDWDLVAVVAMAWLIVTVAAVIEVSD